MDIYLDLGWQKRHAFIMENKKASTPMITAEDLDGMGKDELQSLKKLVEKALKDFEKRNLQKARQAAEAAVREYGVTLAEVVPATGSKKAPPPAKYSNPEDPTQTWSGLGRRPKWFLEAIEAGKTVQELEIG
ncbi:H-NS histone family protein [Epibacterium sp. DP7N7-1]|nr:H-NS histone family protein [Epibacterium sp. DP7N7-1]